MHADSGSFTTLRKSVFPSALFLGLGIFFAVSFYVLASRWEHNAVKQEFAAECEIIFHEVMQVYHNTLIVSSAMHGLMSHEHTITEHDFVDFAMPLRKFLNGVQAVEWVQRVMGSEREKFVESIRQQGRSDFEIRALQPDGTLKRAENREVLFPITYVYPKESSSFACGLDLQTFPLRREALKQSRQTGLPSLSGRIRLEHEQEDRFGLLFFYPVFERLHGKTGASGLERLRGAVLLVLDVNALFEPVFPEKKIKGMGAFVHDLSAPEERKLLYEYQVKDADYKEHVTGLHRSFEILAGQRKWRITCVALPEFGERFQTLVPIGGGVGIFLVMSLLSGYLYMLSLHRDNIRAQVEEKTRELQRSVLRLHCLYEISSLVERPGERIETVLEHAARIVVADFSDGRDVRVVIAHAGKMYGDKVPLGEKPFLDEIIRYQGGAGYINVYCRMPEAKKAEYENERAFLKSVAAQLGKFIERRMVEEGLVAARDQARLATQAKSLFLANMSHEVRTPLNAIIGLTEIVRKTGLSSRQMDYLDKIAGASQSLLGIVNDILDFSKIEAGKLEFEKAAFDLPALLLKILDVYSPRAHAKGLRFNIFIEPGTPARVIGDALRLEQVYANLVTNAVKFTETGFVEVGLGTVREVDGKITIKGWVKDSGIGMSSGDQARLFEAFTQADGSHTRRHGGTGLGLTIARQLVQLMEGELFVSSEQHKGSIFHFEAAFAVAEPENPLSPEAALSGKRAILVQQEHEEDRAFSSLEELGFQVETFGNASAAWLRLRDENQEKVDLVWLGWRLADENGLELARRIRRSEERFSAVPMVLATGNYNEDLRKAARQLTNAVLLRPVSGAIVAKTVARIFDIQRVETDDRDMTALARNRNIRILIVEDNDINRQVLREVLEGAGIHVHEAENGRQAVDMVMEAKDHFDAVVMDVQMPVMGGLEASQLIREHFSADSLPIVALTAHATVEDRQKCLDAGMNDYVIKPLDVPFLFRTLARLVEGHAWEDQTVLESDEQNIAAGGMPEVPGLDVHDGLKRLGGKVEVYKRLLLAFLNDYADVGLSLQRSLDQGNEKDALTTLHTLKGISGNIAASELYQTCVELEEALKQGTASEGLMAEFTAQLDMVMESLGAFFGHAAARSDEESCVVSTQSVDLEKVAELRTFLLAHDFRAVRAFEALKNSLECWLESHELGTLEQSINNFDFASALSMLEAVMTDRNISLPE